MRSARLLRDIQASAGSEAYQQIFGDLLVDLKRRELRRNHQVVITKPREFDLLAFLSQHKGTALTRETILEKVWGWDYIGNTRTVDVHVRWLREKIEVDPANPQRIITVRGTGYRFDG